MKSDYETYTVYINVDVYYVQYFKHQLYEWNIYKYHNYNKKITIYNLSNATFICNKSDNFTSLINEMQRYRNKFFLNYLHINKKSKQTYNFKKIYKLYIYTV